jgi:hypothetical protein
VRLTFAAHSDPDLAIIWRWFEFQAALIAEERDHLRRLVPLGLSALSSLREHEHQFILQSWSEVDAYLNSQRAELELLAMFELLATAEAILRIDFDRRATMKRKDPLSRRFRQIRAERTERVRLDEDILEALRSEIQPASVVSEFRGALRLRHWLAHGRHWHPKMGRGYGPNDVFDISQKLIDALPE